MIIRKSTSTAIPFVMLGTDHVTPTTGLTVSVTIAKNGGAFASAGGSVTELSHGWYKWTASTTDTNTVGFLAIRATASGAADTNIVGQVVNYDFANIQNTIWDEVLTGATHNVATSAGRRLRTLANGIIYNSTLPAQTGINTSNQIKLDTDADDHDGAYDPAIITLVTGSGAGQSRMVYQYAGSTRVCTLDRDWKMAPSAGDEFVVTADPGREHVNEGLARGGTTNTVTLNVNASAYDDTYIGQVVFIRSGTGADQACRITAYNGTTKTATVAKNWDVIPDTTSAYVMLPTAVLDITTYAGMISDTVWSEGVRTLTQAVVTPTVGIASGAITAMRGDTFSQSLTGLGTLANYSAIYWTVKNAAEDIDAEATIQIIKSVSGANGLIILNGETHTTTTDGSITIDSSPLGNITLALTAEIMAVVPPGQYYYDVEIIRSIGVPVSTLAIGTFEVIEDITMETE